MFINVGISKEEKPELLILLKIVFISSQTQTYTERSFSKFDHIFAPKRNKLVSVREDILVIILNEDLLENTVKKHLS